MKKVDLSKLSPDECSGIQIMGTSHCAEINCKFQKLTACNGKNIIRTGKNSKGYPIGPCGLMELQEEKNN